MVRSICQRSIIKTDFVTNHDLSQFAIFHFHLLRIRITMSWLNFYNKHYYSDFRYYSLVCSVVFNINIHLWTKSLSKATVVFEKQVFEDSVSHYTTVSARQLLFVWCLLSDDCQMPVRSDICKLPPDICQTSTTYSPDIYHTSDRYMVDVWYMSGGRLVYIWYSLCLVGIWYMSGVYVVLQKCLTDVWWELTDVWWYIWQPSDNRLMIVWQVAPDK